MMYTQVIDIIREFEGVIGAVLGAVSGTIGTLITTHLLKNKGKIDVRLIESKIKTFNHKDGWYNEDVSFEEAEGLFIDFDLELYNESESPKYLNNFKIQVIDARGNSLVENDVYAKDTMRQISGRVVYDTISYTNVEPKILVKQGIHCSLDINDCIKAKDYKKIVFIYTDNKEKKRSILVQER